MNSESVARELAEPNLRRLLSTAGLDVEYVSASGNTLYRKGANGERIPVLDYAAGYGALIFGHNHPDIVARARELLDEQTPVLAQFSSHPYANQLAEALNRLIRRETGSDEPYYATFANSGAEGIEAAIKHAELDRVLRLSAVLEEIEESNRRAREAVQAGTAVVPESLGAGLGLPRPAAGQDPLDLLIAEIDRRNQRRRARPPVFVALQSGFHGKLMGSVQLTHNEAYRTPFAALGAQARFVPCDRPEALKEVLQDERGTLLQLTVEDGGVRLVERDHHTICAVLLEPVQGEGGIRPLSREFAQEIRAFAEEADCPVVIDEIQSGMGRTGSFLGATRLGLRGDYYVFAKSLGGGLAKASVTLVREGRYRPEFELLHSSTFAKDSFSCHIALKVLQMLEADGGQGYRLARERGAALAGMLRGLRSDFPDVVRDVRGHGLMLGFEFHDQSEATDDTLREAARSSMFGYVIAGHLLHAHAIRTFPTASAVHTLRFEPSLLLTDEEIDRLEHALRDVCTLVRDQAGHRLVLSS
ncbi:aspartate aminotransferase family protein [Streptomyces sp. NPDC057740]|uniref:aspartate aminotransferase family protein n=1 Tax=Streptomyces sp. NPDC057740 TaxID=3346234 RepID=UPI003677324C